MLSNGDLGELLWLSSRDEPAGHRRRALERASRAARFWPVEAGDLAEVGRLAELQSVGPWIADKIETWLGEAPRVLEPDETRAGFLTLAEVRRALASDPGWETEPCADLQMHTTWSDGSLPLDEMVRQARSLGRSFVAITDHSETLAIAHGMSPDQLRRQGAVIDELNLTYGDGDPFRVLRSIEADVFPDGSVDMADELDRLDLVLGAFHSKLRLKEEQTERYRATLRNPKVHILAHPKARMYGRRVGLVADWLRVFAEAARLGKALELDATPARQDLSVELATLARAEGVRWFSIGSDAHTAEELRFLPFGMATAALAGIGREQILNYRTVDEVRTWAVELSG